MSTTVAIRGNGGRCRYEETDHSVGGGRFGSAANHEPRLRDAKEKAKDKKRADLEKTIGGQASRVDESVVNQAECLMARIALIAKRKTDKYSSAGNPQLEAIVKKLGAVVGDLEDVHVD